MRPAIDEVPQENDGRGAIRPPPHVRGDEAADLAHQVGAPVDVAYGVKKPRRDRLVARRRRRLAPITKESAERPDHLNTLKTAPTGARSDRPRKIHGKAWGL